MRVFYLLLTLLLLSYCGSDESVPEEVEEPTVGVPTGLSVRDIANAGDATDLEFSFQKPTNIELVEEFRVFIVKSSSANAFDSLAAINATEYAVVPRNSNGIGISFEATQTDTDGDLVVEDVAYSFFVLSKATAESEFGGALSRASSEISLEQKSAVKTLTQSFQAGSGGMDVDAEGNIYMGDFGPSLGGTPGPNVYKITPSGVVTVFATGLVGASGNDFDDQGNLYQSSIQAGTVSKITPDGQVTTFATGLSAPVGVAFDGTSDFYVCNCGNHTISKVDQDGNVTLFSSSGLLACPNGIDIDDEGNLYIANFNSSVIVKITPEGVASSFANMPGNNMGHLLIRDNFIYVAARGNNGIYKIDFNGNVSLFAGNGSRGLQNGSLNQASFSLPNDLAFSPDGTKMYINDVAVTDPTDNATISPVVIREIDIVN